MSIYGRSRMGMFMLIGGVIGCSLSLFGRETRSVWGNRLSTAATNSGKLIQTVYRHPDQVGRYLTVTGTRIKGLAREVSEDFQQMVDCAGKARTSTGNTYQYVMEAGNEITEMAGKIRRAGQNIARFDDPVLVDSEQDALQRLENETSVPNPGTMPKQPATDRKIKASGNNGSRKNHSSHSSFNP
ncbi:hypothetical protein [Sporolactobacillus pectinivorans]|uniref:hypothetical protein n=1 Tax=Sporolactobacillus pectinivorans TaxID=1591408 RepID=UPI001EFE7653|nr:hypothetical protein [Sporolactobacillus pectinivorans]